MTTRKATTVAELYELLGCCLTVSVSTFNGEDYIEIQTSEEAVMNSLRTFGMDDPMPATMDAGRNLVIGRS